MIGRETQISVNGYQLSALEWNPSGTEKVIACHGWLDNAASFIRLAPLLDRCHVLALDLAGHGHSDHRPPQATYNIWDDLTDIVAVADSRGWDRFHLLGHSRGGMVSLLLSVAMPERIRSLTILDALVPQPVTHADTAVQLGQFLRDNLKTRKRRHPGYASVEKAVEVRCRAINMNPECARPILERSLVKGDGRFYWRSDPRLSNASAFKMTDRHNRAVLASLNVPALILWADKGVAAWDYARQLVGEYPQLKPEIWKGSHHFHMESEADRLAGRIDRFYQSLSV